MSGAYVTNITHFLDEAGDLRTGMPDPARKLASFLVLVIDAVSQNIAADDEPTGIRCRKPHCTGTIRASLTLPEHQIAWHCPHCGHHGFITNWQGTKWDGHAAQTDRPRGAAQLGSG